MMFFVIHSHLLEQKVKVVDNTSMYSHTSKILMDYVSEKCNAIHIKDKDEIDKVDRYFMLNEDKNKVFIYKSSNDGYIYDNFNIALVECVEIVKYEVKTKTYAEMVMEKTLVDIRDI